MKRYSTWPIFIISLPDAKERRSPLKKTLETAGLRYEIFYAVDARKGVPDKYKNMVDVSGMKERFGRQMSDPEIGCALSHISVYKEIVRRQLPGALVLEDDTLWSDAATALLRKLEPGEIDFLQLDYGWADIWRLIPAKRSGVAGIKFKRLAKNAGLANSYVISKYAAKYLINESSPICFPADWPCDLRPLRPMVCCPRVSRQSHAEQGNSYLESGRKYSKAHSLKPDVLATQGKSVTENRRTRRNPRPEMPYLLYRLLITRVPAADIRDEIQAKEASE